MVKNCNDPAVPQFVLANLQTAPRQTDCYVLVEEVRSEAKNALQQFTFLNPDSVPQNPLLRRYYELGKITNQAQTQRDYALSQQQDGVQKFQKEFFKQQLQNLVKQQQKQQQEMTTIWRDLMTIENETLIRKMNDPNPLVTLFAIQAAGKKRLPVEKESIGLLSNTNPSIGQAARQTLIRLGRGVDFGPDASASPQQVAASVRGWSSWLALQEDADDEDDDPCCR